MPPARSRRHRRRSRGGGARAREAPRTPRGATGRPDSRAEVPCRQSRAHASRMGLSRRTRTCVGPGGTPLSAENRPPLDRRRPSSGRPRWVLAALATPAQDVAPARSAGVWRDAGREPPTPRGPAARTTSTPPGRHARPASRGGRITTTRLSSTRRKPPECPATQQGCTPASGRPRTRCPAGDLLHLPRLRKRHVLGIHQNFTVLVGRPH